MAAGRARAESIALVAEALHHKDGHNAASLAVAEKYVTAFQALAKTNNTLILPANAGDVSNMVAQVFRLKMFSYFHVDANYSIINHRLWRFTTKCNGFQVWVVIQTIRLVKVNNRPKRRNLNHKQMDATTNLNVYVSVIRSKDNLGFMYPLPFFGWLDFMNRRERMSMKYPYWNCQWFSFVPCFFSNTTHAAIFFQVMSSAIFISRDFFSGGLWNIYPLCTIHLVFSQEFKNQ